MQMSKQLSFIIPEMDLNFRLARLLIIFDKLSYSSKGNPVLNIERVAIFEFLVKYPHILKLVLRSKKENTNIEYNSKYMGSIESLFPDRNALNNLSSVRVLLIKLIRYNLIRIEKVKKELYFVITEEGEQCNKEISSQYTNEISLFCEDLKVLRSTSINDLKKIITPLIKGV
ncbi:ABC-three component system middle component 4 [Bacillus pseudomycoides]|uniref:Uncharacterized protein n=5 Tax=Bacillus pseudomycoides TaxID=64104 RepID=A0A2C3ZZM2_9BACI|nr:ABC-three component system middle component 4 [Bacillus pseudomycoides]PEA82442.1 hypothetical protein CON99_16910 [Bacillus pseudomycoides]PED06933.1 hypothetical protein COO19_18065 [Bacillus pseudomycoides]PEI98912.1 hypothetical protein CN686_04145 [Bacillus pseudomycoides]PEK29768.1 hypothetical protein CN693_00880 [Bacillus pseudomycoides]PEM68283.1 hypothetical protein CN619_24170 [Bacillus pseudomycoides]